MEEGVLPDVERDRHNGVHDDAVGEEDQHCGYSWAPRGREKRERPEERGREQRPAEMEFKTFRGMNAGGVGEWTQILFLERWASALWTKVFDLP
ncbi:hypothetical protein TNCV_113101 [Trichonephila clavipes]|nr:hypothetical protein TNCV_113101 [Trichonephila clavipes]